jgi:hypothetical protein
VEQCEVMGLTSEAGSRLNGELGTLRGFDAARCRCNFASARSGKMTSLPAANVILPTGTRVRVAGLAKAPQHNDKWGQITEFDRVAKRYVVKLPNAHLKLKTENALPG